MRTPQDSAFPVVFRIEAGSNDLTGAPAEVAQQHVMLGMQLRDYFAAKAMQAALTNDAMLKRIGERVNKDLIAGHEDLVAGAYAIADAMMAERVK